MRPTGSVCGASDEGERIRGADPHGALSHRGTAGGRDRAAHDAGGEGHMRTRKQTGPRDERPQLARGDHVRVLEDGIDAWTGMVTSVKPAPDAWYVDVRRDDDGMTWSITTRTTKLEVQA